MTPLPLQGVDGAQCRLDGTCNVGLACVENTCTAIPDGDQNGSCHPDRTCNDGLICWEDFCRTKETICEGVECSGHGECMVDAEGLRCACEEGFETKGRLCVAVDVIATDGLVARFPFDNPLDLGEDVSGLGAYTNPRGDLASCDGVFAQGADFNGIDAAIEIGDWSETDGDMTLVVFARLLATATVQTLIQSKFHIHTRGSSDQNSGYRFGVNTESDPVTLFFEQTDSSRDLVTFEAPVPELTDGEFHMLAVAKRAGELTLYFDLEEVLVEPVSSEIEYQNSHYHPSDHIGVTNAVCVSCGDWHETNTAEFTGWLHGALDELRVYNRALTVDELEMLVHWGL